jgi:hypothetical protein
MKKKMKIAVITVMAALGVGTVVFAQSDGDNFRQNRGPAGPFTLDKSYGCGNPRGGCGGGYGSENFDDGIGNGYGDSGFGCH